MASGVFHRVQADPIDATIGFTAGYKGPIAAVPRCETTIFAQPAIPLNISRVETLRGARSAMVAFGLEAAVALCVFGAWQVWHLLR
jgi:hypothetical protein